jgi:hypothetical protein
MDTKELLEIYKTLFETWRFQVNSHWQRSSFFAGFETVALAACWKLFDDKPDKYTILLGAFLALLGVALTVVWYLINNRTHKYALYWLEQVGEVETRIMAGNSEWGIDFAKRVLDSQRTTITSSRIGHHQLERAVPLVFIAAWIALLLYGITHFLSTGCVVMQNTVSFEPVSLGGCRA